MTSKHFDAETFAIKAQIKHLTNYGYLVAADNLNNTYHVGLGIEHPLTLGYNGGKITYYDNTINTRTAKDDDGNTEFQQVFPKYTIGQTIYILPLANNDNKSITHIEIIPSRVWCQIN